MTIQASAAATPRAGEIRALRWTVPVLLVSIATLLVACSGSSGGSGGSPEGVASRALSAMIDGDEQTFLQEVRPDRRETDESLRKRLRDLRGCEVDDTKTVVEATGVDARISFTFQESCGGGEFVLYANKGCDVRVEKETVGGDERWFLSYPDVDCAADLDTRDRFP